MSNEMTGLWRKESGGEVVVEPREPVVVYDAYSPDGHYLGPVTEALLRRNGFEKVREG